MPIQKAPQGCTRESLERVAALSGSIGVCSVSRAAGAVAHVQPGLAGDELALGVDRGDGARHEGQVVDDGLIRAVALFEQLAAIDVEPEHGARRLVIGRAFAEFADHVREERRAGRAHDGTAPQAASQAATAARAFSPTASALSPGL